MSIRSTALLALVATLAAASIAPAQDASAPPQDQPGSAYGYYYFKAWHPLPLDAAHIAVKVPSRADLNAALSAVGLDPRAARAWPLAGWWLVDLENGADQRPAAQGEDARIRSLVSALAAQPAIQFATPVFVGLDIGPLWPTADVITGFDLSLTVAQRDAALQAHKLTGGDAKLTDRDWDNLPGVDRVATGLRSGFDVLDAANSMALSREALFSEPDLVMTARHDIIPNDPMFNQQWGLYNSGQSGGVVDMDVNAAEAWNFTTGSPSVVVMVLETGVELTHPDLNMASTNRDFTVSSGVGTGGAPGNACDMHGTCVAGTIAARINNNLGVAGVAPTCRVASARIGVANVPCDNHWTGLTSWTVDALAWAVSSGFRVTNNSNGYGAPVASIDTAYANAHNAGIVSFASAGNGAAGVLEYPASCPSVNAVAAIDRRGLLASFSQYGPGLKFAAPGVAILTTDRTGSAGYSTNDYASVDGTSFSSPYTAGVAALVISRNPAFTASQVEQAMYSTCKDRGDPGYDTHYGFGIPDALAAMQVSNPGPNNDFCTAAADVSATGTFHGTLINATYTSGETGGPCGSAATNPDVWYRFTTPLYIAGTVRVTSCGTNDTGGADAGMDTVLSLHAGCGGTVLDCNDDWPSATAAGCAGLDLGASRDSAVSTLMSGNQTVLIRVSKYGASAPGPFTLNVFFTPINDNCADATDTSSVVNSPWPSYFDSTFIGATNDGACACGNAFTTPDVWYTFTAPTAPPACRLTVSTCGSNDYRGVDTVLSLHAYCGGPALTCNDDWPSTGYRGCRDSAPQQYDSVVQRDMTPGETVLVRVARHPLSINEEFQLTVEYRPLNDHCFEAQPISNGTTPFDTTYAGTDGSLEPTCHFCCSDSLINRDVWFKYTAPCDGPVNVSTCGSSFDTKLAIYNGSECPAWAETPLVCGDDSLCGTRAQVAFTAVAGQQFLIRVGGFQDSRGTGQLTITCNGSACGSADFDCDGDIGTDADIEAFFACLAGGCPALPCTSSADFNSDGDIGTDADIEAFFRVLAGGPC